MSIVAVFMADSETPDSTLVDHGYTLVPVRDTKGTTAFRGIRIHELPKSVALEDSCDIAEEMCRSGEVLVNTQQG